MKQSGRKIIGPSGMGIREYMFHMFLRNEKVPKRLRLCDAELTVELCKEFGTRQYFMDVRTYRCMYNKGRLWGKTPPPIKSHSWRRV